MIISEIFRGEYHFSPIYEVVIEKDIRKQPLWNIWR
jgi:hypothetical protein